MANIIRKDLCSKKTDADDSFGILNKVFTFFREGRSASQTFAIKMLFCGITVFFVLSMFISNTSSKNPEPTIMPTSKFPLIGSNAKDISEIIRNYATCIAFAVAGFWAYLTFVRKREKYPRANVTHRIIHKKIDDKRILLKVTIDIHNTGATVMHLDRRLVRVQQMFPWPMADLELVCLKKERTEEQESEIQWPLLGEVDLSGKEQRCEIEPGEKEEFDFDFAVDSEIKSVVIYSYFKNRKKRGREIGWNKTTIYDIK